MIRNGMRVILAKSIIRCPYCRSLYEGNILEKLQCVVYNTDTEVKKQYLGNSYRCLCKDCGNSYLIDAFPSTYVVYKERVKENETWIVADFKSKTFLNFTIEAFNHKDYGEVFFIKTEKERIFITEEMLKEFLDNPAKTLTYIAEYSYKK